MPQAKAQSECNVNGIRKSWHLRFDETHRKIRLKAEATEMKILEYCMQKQSQRSKSIILKY
jgi:hypothetical protein